MDEEVLNMIKGHLGEEAVRIDHQRQDEHSGYRFYKIRLFKASSQTPGIAELRQKLRKPDSPKPTCPHCLGNKTRFRYFDNSSSYVLQMRYTCLSCTKREFTLGGKQYTRCSSPCHPKQTVPLSEIAESSNDQSDRYHQQNYGYVSSTAGRDYRYVSSTNAPPVTGTWDYGYVPSRPTAALVTGKNCSSATPVTRSYSSAASSVAPVSSNWLIHNPQDLQSARIQHHHQYETSAAASACKAKANSRNSNESAAADALVLVNQVKNLQGWILDNKPVASGEQLVGVDGDEPKALLLQQQQQQHREEKSQEEYPKHVFGGRGNGYLSCSGCSSGASSASSVGSGCGDFMNHNETLVQQQEPVAVAAASPLREAGCSKTTTGGSQDFAVDDYGVDEDPVLRVLLCYFCESQERSVDLFTLLDLPPSP